MLALVLGDKAEEAFRQSMLMSQGSVAIFWSNGLVGTIMALGLVALFWPVISNLLGRLFARSAAPRDREGHGTASRLDVSARRGIMNNVSQTAALRGTVGS